MLKKIPFIKSLTLICTLLLVSSCSENPSSVNEEPPQLPSVQSMTVDFSAFEDHSAQKSLSKATTDNFGHAAITAGIMKFVVDMNLAIPRALLAAAAESDAKLVEDAKWEWNYSKDTGDFSYGVRLTAERVNEETVDWEFYVTNTEIGLEDRLFFRGATSNKASEGSWSYYSLQPDEAGVHVSDITWAVQGEDDVELKLEVVSNRYEKQGDYLDYSFDGTIKKATYYNASEESTTIIEWNVETHVGYIISPDYNGGEKACWDENLQDITCSE